MLVDVEIVRIQELDGNDVINVQLREVMTSAEREF